MRIYETVIECFFFKNGAKVSIYFLIFFTNVFSTLIAIEQSIIVKKKMKTTLHLFIVGILKAEHYKSKDV